MVKDTKTSTENGQQSGKYNGTIFIHPDFDLNFTFKIDTPGPGSYVAPSDFGHLDFGNRNSPREV